jgi:hypothetical protein
VHEVRELARLVAGKEQSSTPNEEDLRRADPRRVKLVVHHDGARAMQGDASALIFEALRGAAIRLPERLAQRDLDPGGEVVVVLLPREVGDLLRDLAAGVPLLTRDLDQEIEAALGPQSRAQGGFARDDDVGRAGSDLGRRADLRRKAHLSHRWRV